MEEFKKCSGGKKLKDYRHQKKIAEILEEMDEREKFSTLVTVPTGGGKTKIAADFCMKKLSEEGNKVLWIADRLELLKQSIERIGSMDRPRDITYQLLCSGMAVENEDGKQSQETRITVEKISGIKPQADMLFASVQTIAKHGESEENENKFQGWLSEISDGKLYIIYDEAHHVGAETVQKFFGELLGTGGQAGMVERFGLIGLTATVYRMDSSAQSFNKWFKNGWENGKVVIGSEKPYGQGESEYVNNRIEIVSIKDLIEEGILKKPDIIRVDAFKDGMPEDEVAYLADRIQKKYKGWGKTIVFVRSVKMANDLADKLKSSIPCFAYTYMNAKGEDYEKVKEFKKPGNKSVMISVDMVSEGFDVPDIETIYLYNKILSQIKIRQRIGRVLRQAKDKRECRVIWQKYYPEKKVIPNANIKDRFVSESDKDIRREVAEYKKGNQIPPGVYLEKLPKSIEEERELYEYLEFLEILDIFGTESYTEGKGISYYKIGEEDKIYFKISEEKGYRQYYQMIMTDYYRELVYLKEEEYRNFADYARILGFKDKSNELIEYIKKTCFYMSNIKEKDTEGAIAKKRLTVLDRDIMEFYEYVVKNGEIPEHETLLKKISRGGSGYTAILEKGIIEKYVEENKGNKEQIPKERLIDAMKAHHRILHGKKEKFKERKYAEILPYGEYGKFQYNEMESARFLMRLGASYEERIKGSHGSLKGEIAFIGKKRNGEYYNVDTYHRTTNQIADNDLCLIAEALVTVPNHIRVSEKDVEQYEDLLLKNYKNSFQVKGNLSKERLAQEFLMALGYSWDAEGNEHDDIIRMQCEIFKDKLPRILQYVIYCKCYEWIMKKAKYCKGGILSHKCQNVRELEQKYRKMLQSYGIKNLDDDLCPVEDVLYDCRPYLKVVPNYQGIKPEFLCRMLNDILLLGKKQKQTIVDAFGGSGAISMNINESLKMKQIYNDIGIMNEKLFKSIKGEEGLKSKVEEFIELVVEDRNEGKAKEFFQCYEGLLKKEGHKAENDYNFINDSFEIIRKKFRDKDNTNGRSEEGEQKDRELVRENYAAIYTFLYNKTIETHMIQEIEEFLLPLILEVKKIYRLLLNVGKDEVKDYNLKDADIAFIFFVYNSFVARYQYSGATIDLLDRFVSGYEKWLRWGREKFGRIRVKSEDALGLMERKKNEERYVWYCDIPYTGTSAQNYVEKVLNTGEFVKRLSECKGSYVVSSRFNIGDGSKNMDEKKKKKQYWNILKFYSSFLPEECIREYVEKIKEELKIEKADEDELYYISKEKKAKYILFAFTRTGRMHSLKKKDKTEETRETFRSNTLMKEDSIRRMLHNTQFGNIPVEIMLTDMKLDLDKMPVKKLGEEFVFWYMPTFATDNAYGVEPVTIIMKYENFVKQMLFRIVSEKVVNDVDTANIAAAFYEILMKN